MATIYDVAKAAGVSPKTVSRVLNGDAPVNARTRDAVNAAMVSAVHQIGHVMRIKTVAEFVENDAVLQKLRETGVDYAQGYHVHAPAPLAQTYELIRTAYHKTS